MAASAPASPKLHKCTFCLQPEGIIINCRNHISRRAAAAAYNLLARRLNDSSPGAHRDRYRASKAATLRGTLPGKWCRGRRESSCSRGMSKETLDLHQQICTIIGTARIVGTAGSMKRHSVCPSVCPSMCPQQQTCYCRFAAVGPGAGVIDCCSSGMQQVNVGSVMLPVYGGSRKQR